MEPGGGRAKPPTPFAWKGMFFYIEKSSHIRKNLSTWGFFPGSFLILQCFFETSSNLPLSSQEKTLGRVELERY